MAAARLRRLALAVAAQLQPRFADGAHLVELAALPAAGAEVSPIEQAVTGALGLTLGSSPSLVGDVDRGTAGPRRAADPGQSRTRGGRLSGAGRRPATCLFQTPDPGDQPRGSGHRRRVGVGRVSTFPHLQATRETTIPGSWIRSEAVTPFVERARSRLPDFTLVLATLAPPLTAICRRLDGLPLAIELAVARLPALSLSDLAARLDDRFALLSRGNAAAEPRQQTLRATMDWKATAC